MGAGPFQTLIFADSICSLATAAPLVYITKPWQFASWRLVVTLLSFQVPILVRWFSTAFSSSQEPCRPIESVCIVAALSLLRQSLSGHSFLGRTLAGL